jgi:hypothetical protein
MVLNVLSQQQTRYILNRADLEDFLQSKYGTSHNFNIQVCTPNIRSGRARADSAFSTAATDGRSMRQRL